MHIAPCPPHTHRPISVLVVGGRLTNITSILDTKVFIDALLLNVHRGKALRNEVFSEMSAL